jgi:hypothetical protein
MASSERRRLTSPRIPLRASAVLDIVPRFDVPGKPDGSCAPA